jgi:hypothetical protein
MRAEAVFPIREGVFAGPIGGGSTGTPPCTLQLIPDLMNRTLDGARQKWIDEGFVEANFTFSPASAAGDWLVNLQTFTPTAAVQDCADPTGQFVHVNTVTPPPCPAGQAQVPDLIGDLVADARVEWADAFSGAFKPAAADNTKTVLTQVTSPVTSPPINGCAPVTAEVTITYGDPPPDPCVVPNMIGLTFAEASADWADAGFAAELGLKTGNSKGTVVQQEPTHPGTISCSVEGKVKVQN